MKPENIATLEKHRHFHDTLIKAFYVKGLNHMEKDDMLRVMREEFNPMCNPDLWCGECISEFIKDLYKRFDEYLAAQPVVKEDGAKISTAKLNIDSSKSIESLKSVKANFPNHKRK